MYALAERAEGDARARRVLVALMNGMFRAIAAERRPWAEFATSASWADQFATQTGTVPARIPIGREVIGPNALLQAAAIALSDWQRTGQAPEAVEIRPVGEEPAIVARDDFARQRFAGNWSIFPPDFEGRNVLQMIRLQAWTAKPA